jgi:hypothetical protein
MRQRQSSLASKKQVVGSLTRVRRIILLSKTELALELSGPRVLSNCTNSAETFQLVQRWLGDCVTNHHRCNNAADKSWRPTRLLQLDKPRPGIVALNCWADEATKTGFEAYVTLSHCWGNGNPLKLTSSTLSTLLEGVPVVQLPLTFQDAIMVTRSLGLKFIWIDSLCIFQDAHENWVRESSLMGKVYSQAFCNIGVTASSTGMKAASDKEILYSLIVPSSNPPGRIVRIRDSISTSNRVSLWPPYFFGAGWSKSISFRVDFYILTLIKLSSNAGKGISQRFIPKAHQIECAP